MYEPLAPQALRLARRVKSWHALERDPLALVHCQRLIAVLYGYANWASLQAAARTQIERDWPPFEAVRLKQFGYTAEAAEKLVAYLSA